MSKTTIWALHGFLGLPSDWKEFPVKAVDITPYCDMDNWAKAFNQQVISSSKSNKNVLMGYSMGGRLALHALNQNPDLWSAVYAISAHPGLEKGHEERLFSDNRWADRFESDDWYPLMSDWMSMPVFKNTRSPLRVESDFKRKDLADFLRNYSLGRQKNIMSDKVHWVVGEQDPFYRALLPKATVIPGAGHRVIFDRPDAIKELCKPWISE